MRKGRKSIFKSPVYWVAVVGVAGLGAWWWFARRKPKRTLDSLSYEEVESLLADKEVSPDAWADPEKFNQLLQEAEKAAGEKYGAVQGLGQLQARA